MKILKFVGYYALFLIYYTLCFTVIAIEYGMPNQGESIGGVGVFLVIAAIASPFLIINLLINKFYPGLLKKKHAIGCAISLIILISLQAIGVKVTEGFNEKYIPFYAFNTCLIIALLMFKNRRNNQTVEDQQQKHITRDEQV